MQRHDDGTPLDPETLTAYQQHIGELLDACKVSEHVYPEQLDGDDLRRMIEKLHADDYEHNSICNHYTSVVAFMRFMKLDHKDEDRFLAKGERPRPRVFKPEAYSHAETDAFFAACDNERYVLAFEMFLKTGGRELEVAHLPSDDLDLGDAPHVTYTENTELNHNTKNRKSRSVPLEAGLAAKLREWRKKNPETKLVFGTEADKVDWHFWRACKRIAEKAGFDPTNWWVHKFRDTFATRALEERPDLLRTLQSWMGHSSIAMTQRYLADAEGQVQQQGINDVFGGAKQQIAVASEADRALEGEKTSPRQGADVPRKELSITPSTEALAVTGTPAF
jgi:integrase